MYVLKKIYKRQVEIEIKFKMDFNSSMERKFPAANTEAAPHVRKKKPLVPRAGQLLTQLRRSCHTLFISHPLVAVFRIENYSWCGR